MVDRKMATYGQDLELIQWTLQLFDSNPYANYEYCSALEQGYEVGQHVEPYYNIQYSKDNQFVEESDSIENDELLAHVLQEELSQLAVAEEPGTPTENLKMIEMSGFHKDWTDSSGNFLTGQDCGQEEVDDAGPSSSSSSPNESTHEEEWSNSLESYDDYGFDGEVGKKLNQMIPIPHVPKINGEIPSLDEATLDHQRLLGRLQLYDLVELRVEGDGNCQFRALSDQIYRTPEHHKFVRQQAVDQLKSQPVAYEGYVPMQYEEYLEKMSSNGEWGDHVTLQAAADLYGVRIFVVTSFKDTCYFDILPKVQRSNRVILLSFWAEVHYNSLYPQGEISTIRTKKKRRWRMFRTKHMEYVEE